MLHDLVDGKRVESVSGIFEIVENFHPVRCLYAELSKLLVILMVIPTALAVCGEQEFTITNMHQDMTDFLDGYL